MKFSWGKKKLKRRLSTALVFIMVSSSVMPAYADSNGIAMSLNNNASFSEEILSEETLEAVPEASSKEELTSEDNTGGEETTIEETDETAQETEEESVEEPAEETDENLEETKAEPEETEESPE